MDLGDTNHPHNLRVETLVHERNKALSQREDLETAVKGWLVARDAVADYLSKIPDGCRAEPGHLGRLVRNETRAENAVRAVIGA